MRHVPPAPFWLLLFFSPLALAQEAGALHAPVGRDRTFVMALYFPPKPNAPFTAISKTIVVRILPDQSTITVQNSRTVARDMDGRVFQERRYLVPDDGRHQSRLQALEYVDPVAHTYYTCTAFSRVCQLNRYSGMVANTLRPAGLQPDGTTYLTREDLGPDTFAGLDVEHSRETYTFYKESIGNSNTILRTIEYWYSPQLGVNVQVKVHDARDGDETLWLTDISLTAPDPRTFIVPSDFRVVDHRNPKIIDPDQAGQQDQ